MSLPTFPYNNSPRDLLAIEARRSRQVREQLAADIADYTQKVNAWAGEFFEHDPDVRRLINRIQVLNHSLQQWVSKMDKVE